MKTLKQEATKKILKAKTNMELDDAIENFKKIYKQDLSISKIKMYNALDLILEAR